jgi:hypothetical protein
VRLMRFPSQQATIARLPHYSNTPAFNTPKDSRYA